MAVVTHFRLRGRSVGSELSKVRLRVLATVRLCTESREDEQISEFQKPHTGWRVGEIVN